MTCPFCDIIDGKAEATNLKRYAKMVTFEPLNPVTPGHLLVVPEAHIANAADDPVTAAAVMELAADLTRLHYGSANLITSVGEPATQTVWHMHLHIVPRRFGDGLKLPWTDRAFTSHIQESDAE